MVRPVQAIHLLCLLVLGLSCLCLAESPSPSGPVFRASLSKNRFYPGEQIGITFYVEAALPHVEVEVAKFPEFRGFWSENLSLRQGGFPLIPSLGTVGRFAGQIGTYSLYAMQGESAPQIEPMRILLRTQHPVTGESQDTFLLSELPKYQLLKLPPIPTEFKSLDYSGAVGHFYLSPGAINVNFSSNEPISIRIPLQGDGNFAEVISLPILFPPSVEVLSRRSFVQGTGTYATKTFEYTLSLNGTSTVQIPSRPWLFFNPSDVRFEILQIPEIVFQYVPPTQPLATESLEPLQWAEPEPLYTPHRDWLTDWRWRAQFLFGLLLLCTPVLLNAVARIQLAWRNSPTRRRRQEVDATLALLSSGDLNQFLAQSAHLSRARLQQSPERSADPAAKLEWQKLLQWSDAFFYSPEKALPCDPQEFAQVLRGLRN